jgi:spore coat polysaccharide biosynthesis protein SpsF
MGHAGVIGIVLQARLGSTRLPGKVLRDMGGRPMLSHTLARLQMVQRADQLIVAIPDNPDNDELALYCRSEQVECFRGSEGDVLARYYDCAYHYGLAHIVRATADCPLVDPGEVDALIALHLERGADYSSSKEEVGCGLPNGTGSEMFTFTALERSHRQGNEPHHREHINEYIVEHPELFRICAYREPPGKSAPQLDLTVDTAEDFALVQGIVEHFGRDHQALTTQAIIAYCETRVPR